VSTKYKTKRCRQYHSTGACPYGKRCQFIHEEAETPSTAMSPKSATDYIHEPQIHIAQQQQQQPKTIEVKKPSNLGYIQPLNFLENPWDLSTEDETKPVLRKRLPAFQRITTTTLPVNPGTSTCDSEEEEDDFDFIAKFAALTK